MASRTTSPRGRLPREGTPRRRKVEAPNLNQFQWPAFHLIEHPMGGTNATGGSLSAVRALRTSRMTCCRTPFGRSEERRVGKECRSGGGREGYRETAERGGRCGDRLEDNNR